jgi:hypothetical protein
MTRVSWAFCPPVRPSARAADRPSRVRSIISACSNAAMVPRIWKNIRPIAVGVSALPHQPTSRGSSGLLVHCCSEPS